MWKSLFLNVLRVVALIVLIVQLTFSPALAQETPEAVNTQPPEMANPNEVKLPIPDEPKAEDSTTVPSSNPKPAPKISKPKVAYPQPPHPYDMQAIEEFNQELYGKGN